MISTRSAVLVMDTVVCLTLAKWETVSGHFRGYLRVQHYCPTLSIGFRHCRVADENCQWPKLCSGPSLSQHRRYYYDQPHYSAAIRQVTVLDHVAFTYMAKPDFQDEDSFSLQVSGVIKKVNGTSTIRIVVSILGR